QPAVAMQQGARERERVAAPVAGAQQQREQLGVGERFGAERGESLARAVAGRERGLARARRAPAVVGSPAHEIFEPFGGTEGAGRGGKRKLAVAARARAGGAAAAARLGGAGARERAL